MSSVVEKGAANGDGSTWNGMAGMLKRQTVKKRKDQRRRQRFGRDLDELLRG